MLDWMALAKAVLTMVAVLGTIGFYIVGIIYKDLILVGIAAITPLSFMFYGLYQGFKK